MRGPWPPWPLPFLRLCIQGPTNTASPSSNTNTQIYRNPRPTHHRVFRHSQSITPQKEMMHKTFQGFLSSLTSFRDLTQTTTYPPPRPSIPPLCTRTLHTVLFPPGGVGGLTVAHSVVSSSPSGGTNWLESVLRRSLTVWWGVLTSPTRTLMGSVLKKI